MRRLLILLLVCLPVALPTFAETLQFADRARIVSVSDPQIAPDGRQIAVVVSRANLKDNRFDTEVALVDVASGAQRTVTVDRRGVAQPRWSPDGTRLSFLAMHEGKRQIWIAPLAGGDARKLTDNASGVQQYAWDPSGTRIAFVAADEPPKKSEEEKHVKAFEVGDDDFLITSAALPSHLWLIGVDGGAAKRLTSGEWSLPVARPPGPLPSPINWSPDGKSIAFARMDTPHSGNTDTTRIALIDVESGSVRRLTGAAVQEGQPILSPDGKTVAFIHPRGGERQSENRIWIVPAGGGTGTELTKDLDRNQHRAFWMPDGKSLLVGAHTEATTGLWIQPLAGGAPKRLELGEIEPVSGFSIDANVHRSGAIAFTGTTPRRPRELYYLENANAKPRRLTNFNEAIERLELGRAERITFSNEGYDLDGIVVTPPRYDPAKKYPLVLYIHGGPRASSTLAFSFLPQILAAQDWIVFQPNYRGSDNLGDRVTRAIIMDAGAGPGRDVMAGMEVVKKRFNVDESRIGVGGWSYGGYMTSWMIGNYPTTFKAAVSGAAVNNMLDQYTLGDYNVQRGALWGSPYKDDNMKRYIEQSPITYAHKVRTPTLILSNTGDARVPVTQSFQMYRALKDNGVPVKFILYPLSGHNADDPAHQSDVDRRYVEWFKKYL
ncbi:MAG TPA: S9 family peptidase [Thermoanaerobaculia bacterium]|jgi:dipeptidyl aminopeptidase/acylaminoacyl peptidase